MNAQRQQLTTTQRALNVAFGLYVFGLLALPIWMFELIGLGEGGWMWLPILAIWIALLWLSPIAGRQVRDRYRRYMARRRAARITEWGAVS